MRRDAGLQKLMIQAKVRGARGSRGHGGGVWSVALRALTCCAVRGNVIAVFAVLCVALRSWQAIMRMALPIQCMEALFLATYLTLEYKQVWPRPPLRALASVGSG